MRLSRFRTIFRYRVCMAVAPAEAMIDQESDSGTTTRPLSVCPDLRAAMAKDASLAITVEALPLT